MTEALSNPNHMWHAWKTTFMNVVERHAPLRTKRVRNSKSPWISVELKQRMRERDFLKTKAIKTQDPLDWAVFKKSRNFVNSEIKKCEGNAL